MTDKEQIIIDGVNVSECRYGEIEKDVFKCSCEYNVRSASMFCKDNPNCHYKLYKRKEQEYEELRQYHNKCCEEFEKEKQNLIDRYNQFSKDFFIGKYCKKEYCDLLKAKEQELEELKVQLKNSENARNYAEKVCIDIELKKKIYKQALDEIEKELKEDIYCENQECGCDDFEECLKCTKEYILDIINKAKGTENAQTN